MGVDFETEWNLLADVVCLGTKRRFKATKDEDLANNALQSTAYPINSLHFR